MRQGRIIVISGSPGAGKTTIATIIAHGSGTVKSAYLHTDSIYQALSKGVIAPYSPESSEQNLAAIEGYKEAAKGFACGGYDVVVDGIIGPWFLEPWRKLAREDYEVHYIVLRASKEETLKRAGEHPRLDKKTSVELTETLWEQFRDLGAYESFVVDTTKLSIRDTVDAVRSRIEKGEALLAS